MAVYTTATKLAEEIRNSKEYTDFNKSMQILKKDKASEELLKMYKASQMQFQSYEMNKQEVDRNTKKHIDDIQKKVNSNKKVKTYLIHERKFTTLMAGINNIIGKAIEKDYK